MEYIEGKILKEGGFEKGWIGFDDNIIEEGKGKPPKKAITKGLITPTFVNSHTHIGDTFLFSMKDKFPRNIKKLVGPNGIKHSLLKKARKKEIIEGMNKAIKTMIASGTTTFCDFREGGIEGIESMKIALDNKKISPLILSRPSEMRYDKEEVKSLLKNSEGIGVSDILDWDYPELEKLARHAKREGTIFALHASEQKRENIDSILDLEPDFLVHMVFATNDDLEIVADSGIPIVLCPRSNSFFGLRADVDAMIEHGIKLMLGTDNAMLFPPRILDETRYLYNNFHLSIERIMKMITYTPRKCLNVSYNNGFVVVDEGLNEIRVVREK